MDDILRQFTEIVSKVEKFGDTISKGIEEYNESLRYLNNKLKEMSNEEYWALGENNPDKELTNHQKESLH